MGRRRRAYHAGDRTRHALPGRLRRTHARYLFAAADIDSFAQSHDSLHAPAFADSVQPVIDAGLVDPTHFTGTAAGRVLSTDQGYRFVPQP
jgi:hypothetical protein